MSNQTQKYTIKELIEDIEETVPPELTIEVDEGTLKIALARNAFALKVVAALKSELMYEDELMNISGLGVVFKGVDIREGEFYGVWTILYEVADEGVQEFEFKFELLSRQEASAWTLLNREGTDEVAVNFDGPNVAEA